VHAFIDDGFGYFWQPNTNGLFKVSKQEIMDYAYCKAKNIYISMLTNNNGPRTNEFSASCEFPFVWLQDRMLSISSIDGLLWFYLTAFLTITLGAYLIYWLRLRNLTENSKMLEKLVDARTMELSKVVEHFVRSESALISNTEIKDKIITIVLHDLRSPISFLNTISNYLAKNHSVMDKAMLEKRLHALHSGTSAFVAYTEQLFAWATTQHKEFKITVTFFKISGLFEEISGLYIGILESHGNTLSILETNLVCQTDYQILSLILRNLIDNANKNTSNGRIVLKAERNIEMITISVTDSGKGLNTEQVRSFMDESAGLTKPGVGSVIILNLLKKNNGSLSIKTAPDSGSIFSVTLHQYFQPYNAGQDC
jgi:K+-sensing histidine kinase KdpD